MTIQVALTDLNCLLMLTLLLKCIKLQKIEIVSLNRVRGNHRWDRVLRHQLWVACQVWLARKKIRLEHLYFVKNGVRRILGQILGDQVLLVLHLQNLLLVEHGLNVVGILWL